MKAITYFRFRLSSVSFWVIDKHPTYCSLLTKINQSHLPAIPENSKNQPKSGNW